MPPNLSQEDSLMKILESKGDIVEHKRSTLPRDLNRVCDQ
uniref:Uncharacterized protein n=1 Tax=Arundo donax TaxID=35708 RepID=A0A0A9ETD8_ARUDO